MVAPPGAVALRAPAAGHQLYDQASGPSGWPASSPSAPDYDVLVVGGGISGLAAARALRARGLSVLVLEAQTRIGGRLQRVRAGPPGGKQAWIDLGGQWVGKTQDRLLALARELGVKMFPTPHSGNDTLVWGGRRTVYRRSFPLPPFNDTELAAAWPESNFTMHERDDLVAVWRRVMALAQSVQPDAPWASPDAPELDTLTIREWLRRTARTRMASWWVGAMSRMGGSGSFDVDASMLHLAWTQRVAPQHEIPETALFDGGAAQFPALLAKELGPDSVMLSTPVLQLLQRGAGTPPRPQPFLQRAARALGLARAQEAGDQAAGTVAAVTLAGLYTARAAIVAMPPHLAGRIAYDPPMPAARDQLTQRMPMGQIIKILAIYDTPWWRDQGLSGTAAGDLVTLEFVADSTNPAPGSPGVLASFIAGRAAARLGRWSPAKRRAAVLDTLAKMLGPAARNVTDYQEGRWPDNPYSGGAFTSFPTLGTWVDFGHALREPVGRIFWAGTETATRWPGYIDGGIRAGERAADEAAALLAGPAPATAS